MLNVLSQILATGITAALFYAFYKHCKKDAEEERERKRKARRKAFELECERAGREFLMRAERERSLKSINEIPLKKKGVTVKVCGDFKKYAKAWED